MQKTIITTISTKGSAIGTIGWLSQQEISFKIGTTKRDKAVGIWIKIANTQKLSMIRGYEWNEYTNDLEIANGLKNYIYPPIISEFQIPWTKTALRKIKELVQLSRKLFEEYTDQLELEENVQSNNLSFIVIPVIKNNSINKIRRMIDLE